MTSEAPHILYVAWGFPPARTSGVYRALATANALANHGFRVTVMTADEDCWKKYTGEDAQLLEQVDPRINLLRVPFKWELLNTDLYEFSWLRIRFPRLWSRLYLKKSRKIFPENSYGTWRPHIEKAALELHESDPVDAVISTANPNVSFTPAVLLHDLYDIPYFVDHRDAWSLDVFDGHTLFSKDSEQGQWEQRIFAGAEKIWFVNEPIAKWHRRHYPEFAEKIDVVPNGWDPDFITPAVPDQKVHMPITFGYLGTVSSKVPLKAFIKAWKCSKNEYADMADTVAHIHGHLGFYGTPHAGFASMLESASEYGVHYKGPASKGEIAEIYEQWDVCLLILGAGQYVTSGKVFEYMATGKPIVSVHDPKNAVADVLAGYPLWFPLEALDATEIARVLSEAARMVRSVTPEQHQECIEFANRYRRDVVLELAIRQVEEVVVRSE